ncbi:phage tail assembly chaperone family protein, TAC [Microbulbifer thermotolerans]|uniref:phage tail assembly chaperone family protein, TAC n=1 Tax=Microbulbifer thermotolerans TaxID=252514 RepID=UPI002671DE44|nr:phage tail assembly chaperone family protein, TAC [Microbulbifer thermotolerans]WKT59105.1 phage tail assembly chaperone family protein, TAC [Microbulbifer thermotolerans]
MELSIDALQQVGAFTGAPVQRQIRWRQGENEFEATVYVRRLSYKTAVSDLQAARGNGDAVAGRIAACIVDAKGKPVFTPEDITGEADPQRGPLDGNLTVALLQAIGEVNNLGKTTGSAKRTSSGTS